MALTFRKRDARPVGGSNDRFPADCADADARPPPGAWMCPRAVQHRGHFSRGCGSIGAVAETYLYLTTIGRRSGRPREIEIWFTEAAGRFYLIAEHGEDAAWVRNLRAEPRVAVRLGVKRFTAMARVVDADTTVWRAAQARSEAKYGWGDGLVVELAPDATPPSSASTSS
jgi:deazaflavin-dependent oxidoreductase (nitroreductase family)